MSRSDTVLFLSTWATKPLQVASVAPSGPALSRLITCEISATTGPVLELGAGTGVFTRALLARGVREDDLVLVECDPGFARLLRDRFPRAKVVDGDAAALHRHPWLKRLRFGAMVSGLPLLSMPTATATAILGGAFERAIAHANFYQFTYGPYCPVSRPVLRQLGLEARRIGWTFRNLPPASVYRISRVADTIAPPEP